MPGSAITAVGLSKRYRGEGQSQRWIDAVIDASFDIDVGESIGLIGPNGAGKSTLLRMLSRVTRPTAGYADITGRVGALLDVGTGFHSELTGRENTYLSGAILGLSRHQVRARFDDIVDFAEIARFIDMPVKHYSSGMYARLGFAVAAFLRPSILIIDEILSVGDLAFQAKCLAHMARLPSEGTTVIFVSHNMLAIADFCRRAMTMDRGRVIFDGSTADAIATYRRTVATAPAPPASPGPVAHELRVNGVATHAAEIQPHDPMRVDLTVERPGGSPRQPVGLNFVVELPDGRMAMHLRNDLEGVPLVLMPGRTTLTLEIDDMSLAPGTYRAWLRVVELDATPPAIWDTEPLSVVVAGDSRREAIVLPRHRFGQHHSSAPVDRGSTSDERAAATRPGGGP
jgi:lipopolysaccharide transport system ATP-binding protein